MGSALTLGGGKDDIVTPRNPCGMLPSSDAEFNKSKQLVSPKKTTSVCEVQKEALPEDIKIPVLKSGSLESTGTGEPAVEVGDAKSTTQQLPAAPLQRGSEDRRIQKADIDEQNHQIQPGHTLCAASLPFLNLGLDFDVFGRGGELQKENEELWQQLDRLREENKMLRDECRVLFEEQEEYKSQFEEVEARANDLLIENMSLKRFPGSQKDDSLENTFRKLYVNVGSWCSEAVSKAKKCQLNTSRVTQLSDMLALGRRIDHQTLESNRKLFGQAITWKFLVDHVFQSSAQDTHKDLWTSDEEAKQLAAIETRLMASDLNVRDLNRWRCLTIAGLAQQCKANRSRIESLSENAFAILSDLFGFIHGTNVNHMRDDFERDIVVAAVELSKDMRMQPSRFYVRLFSEQEDMSGELQCGGSSPEGKRLSCQKMKETGSLELTVRPAMIKEMVLEESGLRERVLVNSVRATILPEAEARCPTSM